MERIRTLLEKTRVLLADGDISALERDIIKDYLKEIYVYVDNLHTPPANTISKPVRKTAIRPPEAKTFKEPVKEYEPTFQKSITPKPIIQEPISKETPSEPKIEPTATSISSQATKPIEQNPKVQRLFSKDASNELSDLLSQQPITQLKQGFSINDRLQFIQVLFNGDNQAFDICVRTLDDCINLSHAKKYLEQQIIGRYDWTLDEKEELATQFVHLVKRRFSESI